MVIVQTNTFTIGTVKKNDYPVILKIYEQSRDFLSLGPISNASMEMVLKDIKHSKEEKGKYCGIWDLKGNLMGIVDFVPLLADGESSFLSLIIISVDYRDKGLGSKVVQALEQYLKTRYSVKRILSAVQTTNRKAICFWKKCGYTVETILEKRRDETVIFKMGKEL